MRSNNLLLCHFFLLIVALWSRHTLADDVNITVNVEVTVPPCVVNGGNPVEVNFGNIPVDRVNDSQYRVVKNLTIICSYYQGLPFIKLTGNTLTNNNDGNVLATTTPNFGIALYQGEGVTNKLMIGNGASGAGYQVAKGLTNVNTANSVFTFTAVPFKSGSATLAAGEFSATASMTLSYY